MEKVRSYDTLVEALADLKVRGYVNDFNLEPDCLTCTTLNIQIHPEDFTVKEVYRFEGQTSPDDNMVLFAVEGKDGVKGVLLDAMGPESEAISMEMAQKLRFDHA